MPGGIWIIAAGLMTASCASGTSSSPSASGQCWPTGTAADGSAQNSPVVVANLHLDRADPQPPPLVTALSASRVASSVEVGASASRTVLATVVSPSTRVAETVWIVIGCDVPYASKAAAGRGTGTAVAAVDPATGRLLYSVIAAS